MSLPPLLSAASSSNESTPLRVITREESFFLSHHQYITVVPSRPIDKMHLIEGPIGPFRPLIPIEVPLYIAIALKGSDLCSVRPPSWLSIDGLEEVLRREEEVEEEYQPLDKYFFDNIESYLRYCDITESTSKLRLLVEQIKEKRIVKTIKGCEAIDGRIININNLTFYEFRQIKEYLLSHMEVLHHFF